MGNHRIQSQSLTDFIATIQEKLPAPLKYNGYIDEKWILIRNEYYKSIETEWEAAGSITFLYNLGHSYLYLYCGKRAFYVYTQVSWKSFLTDENNIQIILRKIFHAISESMAGSRMIYVPDSGGCYVSGFHTYITDGFALSEIEELMLQKCGKPCSNIKDIIAIKSNRCYYDGYFIDTFSKPITDT